jgi:hypothetical protein
MDCIAVPAEGEEPTSVVDRFVEIPDRLLTLLKAMSVAAATGTLVRVKSHYPNVDMAKVKGGADAEKDLAMEVMNSLDYKGDSGEQKSWTRSCTPSSSHSCR